MGRELLLLTSQALNLSPKGVLVLTLDTTEQHGTTGWPLALERLFCWSSGGFANDPSS